MVVVSCMDLRMITKTMTLLNEQGYNGEYDFVSVAGSALSVGLEERQHLTSECRCQLSIWKETICSHVNLAGQLHGAKEVWFIDHEDCGAYLHYYNDIQINEKKQHQNVLKRMPKYFPNIKVRTFWMRLDGTLLELDNNNIWFEPNIYNPDKYWINISNNKIIKIINRNENNITYKYLDRDDEIVLDCISFLKCFKEI